MSEDKEDPFSRASTASVSPPVSGDEPRAKGAVSWLQNLVRRRAASNTNTHQLQEALEDYIEELKEGDFDDAVAESQKVLINNVLKTNDMRVADVMIPRADITAIAENATFDDLKKVFEDHQFSRIPVFRESLDHIVGVVHIKDILICLLSKGDCTIAELTREVKIVTPGLPVMDLFLAMREEKRHMAMVIDEHGGIDGLITLNDIIEAIVGDLEDEFDNEEQPQVIEKTDGSIVADARLDIEEFEERYGAFLTADERDDIDTLGGLAFAIAGRVPKKGETLKHKSGLVLEVVDADSRRVKRVRLRNLSQTKNSDEV